MTKSKKMPKGFMPFGKKSAKDEACTHKAGKAKGKGKK